MANLKKIEIEKLREVAGRVKSALQAAKELGISSNGGATTRLRKLILQNNIDISHWTGQLWSKGFTSLDDERIKSSIPKTDGEPFCEGSVTNPSSVKSLIIKKNLLPYKCAMCNMDPFWNGMELKFQLDHINGIRNDHRMENLRLLCPNCHSQTDTFCAKNKKRKFPSREKIVEVAKKTESISEIITNLGINKSNRKKIETILKEESIFQIKKEKNIKNCRTCEKEIKSRAEKYCSRKCAASK
jgi:Zn finger protein HypA/HybF involved in hydrogenase expression